ncbi:MAG: nucleoside hydrolase [Erysipelotrichaceae bacterium]|nr:nucleoside hydrolase [Erysipelotrichaceae bacterium]
MSEKRKLIIDTDCGSDDAVAIAMALNDPGYEVIMITTVAGNVPLQQATENTLTTLQYADAYCPPVYEGCGEMLLKKWEGARDTHGYDGMVDLGYHSTGLKKSEGHAVTRMLEALRDREDKSIDIVTLGPLTNLAMAIRLDRKAFMRSRRVVVMGSAGLGFGNVTPAAEFNIWQDAEAARIVLEAGIEDLTFVGWDACLNESMLEENEIKEIRESSQLGRFCIDSNHVLMELNRQRFGRDCLDMADPAAMAAALYPDCIAECDRYYCRVDTSEGPSYGSVIIDFYGFTGKKPNAAVCSRLKSRLFKDYLMRMLKVR